MVDWHVVKRKKLVWYVGGWMDGRFVREETVDGIHGVPELPRRLGQRPKW